MKHKFSLRSVIVFQLLVALCFSMAIWVHRKHRLNSALFLAARAGNVVEAEALVKRGASVNAVDELGYSPLFYAVLSKKDCVALMLLDSGADPNIAAPGALTALGQAIVFRKTVVIGALIRHGADIHANQNSGNDCVELAVSTNDPQVIQMIETGRRSPSAMRSELAPTETASDLEDIDHNCNSAQDSRR